MESDSEDDDHYESDGFGGADPYVKVFVSNYLCHCWECFQVVTICVFLAQHMPPF